MQSSKWSGGELQGECLAKRSQGNIFVLLHSIDAPARESSTFSSIQADHAPRFARDRSGCEVAMFKSVSRAIVCAGLALACFAGAAPATTYLPSVRIGTAPLIDPSTAD